ncbi:MAG: cobalt ECF transporter T component CbiQ [Nitrospirae bacterium]|nr:cobalt ECF transporter T component CbiQ [Nitrospirota bacterium]
MKHSFIDKYSHLQSPIHRVDPRIKSITLTLFILFIIFTPPTHFVSFSFYALLIFILILFSQVPVGSIFKRSLVIIPFVLMIAIFIPFLKKGEIAGGYSFGTFQLTVTYDGLTVFWNVFIKSYLSILCLILLSTTTKFSHLLKALESLKFPQIITMIISFMYRYIFVLVDELMRMKRAKDSRTVGGSRLFHIKILANIVGMLFLRSYERGERVYTAMVSRGFDGEARTLGQFHLRKRDIGYSFIVIALLGLIRFGGG